MGVKPLQINKSWKRHGNLKRAAAAKKAAADDISIVAYQRAAGRVKQVPELFMALRHFLGEHSEARVGTDSATDAAA